MQTKILAVVKAAGIKPWDKLFVALRATRDTELREQFPGHVVDAWFGHDEAVAKKNYLQVTDEHFEKAVQYPAESARNDSHADSAELPDRLENKAKRCNRNVQQNIESGRTKIRTWDLVVISDAL